MNVSLGVAGVLAALLAIGHATLGLVWVLPGLRAEHLGTSPFGGPGFSAATIHASWHIVTVFAFSSAVVLSWLAWDTGADPKTVVLRVFALMWLANAIVATWAGARRVKRLRDLLRLPVPILFVVVAALSWNAA